MRRRRGRKDAPAAALAVERARAFDQAVAEVFAGFHERWIAVIPAPSWNSLRYTPQQPAAMPPERQGIMALTLIVTADPPTVEPGGSSTITVEVQGADQPADYVITLHGTQGNNSADGTVTIHQDAPAVDVEGTADAGSLSKVDNGTFTFTAPA